MSDDKGTGLPASIEAAWNLRARPSRGPKRGLSLEQIVGGAIEVAEADGLAAVSMQRVAAAIGASTMSLYRYIAAKDELLALMIDQGSGPPPAPPNDVNWREAIAHWAWAYFSVLMRHPWIVRVPISGPPTTPNQIAWLERGLQAVGESGLLEGEKLSTVLFLSNFVRSEAGLAADLHAATLAAGNDDPWANYWRLLAQLTNPGDFPAIHKLITADIVDEPESPTAGFEFGLQRILDGIAALTHERQQR